MMTSIVLGLSGGGWAISPGHEAVFSQVTAPANGELPDGWSRRAISVPQDRVEVLYGPKSGPAPTGCDEAPLCLVLTHPESARAGAVVAPPFAITVRVSAGGPPGEALVEGVRARIAARGPPSPFKAIKVKLPEVTVADDAEVVTETPEAGGGLSERFGGMLASDTELRGRLLRVDVTPELVRYVLRMDSGDPAEAVVELRNRAARQSDPREVTASFYVRGVGGVTDPPDLARRVHAAVLSADDGRLRLSAGDALATGERPPLHTALIALVLVTLLGLLVGLVPLARLCVADLRGQRVVLGVLAAGAALRFVIEGRLVEMGIGYQLVRYADELLMPRYGAGTTTLHHLVFQVFGADHDVMLATHRVLGVMTLPLAYVAGMGLLRAAPARLSWLGPAWAASLALTPMLVKSDATESNLVPILFALWAGLLAWQRLRGALGAVITFSGVAFVVLSRPEMAVIGPGIWLALARPWERWRMTAAVLLPLVGVATVQLVFIQQVIDWEVGVQSLHLGKAVTGERLLQVLGNNALFDPRLVPTVLGPLALLGLMVRGVRGVTVTLLIGGLAWVYVYAVDLSAASMPRLHIVVVLAWSLPAALGVAALAASRRRLAIVAALMWAMGCLATVPTLWAPTNEDTQQRLYDAVRDAMPGEGGYVLAALANSDAPDPPGHFTHRHIPSYLFEDGMIAALGDLDRWVDGERPVFYFQGTSCHARLLRSQTDETGLLAPCAAVHRAYRLDPVWTARETNFGNPLHQELGYYGPEPHFEVGLWRVVGRAATVQP
ncbi:MAG: hypothetical protein ACPGU1_21240 [Myxococcota bacterium]